MAGQAIANRDRPVLHRYILHTGFMALAAQAGHRFRPISGSMGIVTGDTVTIGDRPVDKTVGTWIVVAVQAEFGPGGDQRHALLARVRRPAGLVTAVAVAIGDRRMQSLPSGEIGVAGACDAVGPRQAWKEQKQPQQQKSGPGEKTARRPAHRT